jgi:hypothetical protein
MENKYHPTTQEFTQDQKMAFESKAWCDFDSHIIVLTLDKIRPFGKLKKKLYAGLTRWMLHLERGP